MKLKNIAFLIPLFLLTFLISGCSKTESIQGYWIFHLQLQKTELPFVIEINKNSDKYSAKLFNAEEVIEINEIKIDDTNNKKKIYIELTNHVSLEGVIQNNQLSGYWIKHGRIPEYKVPFTALKTSSSSRFKSNEKMKTESILANKWKVIFSPQKVSKSPQEGLLLFKSFTPVVRASLLTKTGDYRYLEGQMINDNLTLYGFDGVFAFVFKAQLEAGLLKGIMHAGKDHAETFAAKADANFELPNPEAITYVEPKEALLSFKLKSSNGDLVEFSGKNSKPTILQIFGSWCPNCIDETIFINKWLKDNPNVPVNIYAISFEREDNEKMALKTLKKVKNKLAMQYPLLLGGATQDVKVEHLFPQIKQFISFPTTIYIDKAGKIRKIHTGFNGPATGHYYDEFCRNFDNFVKKLSRE